jgi:short-subunit dehydrogenase
MNKVVFITGVSSGFGLQIAKTLSRQGHVVYGSSRKDGYQLEGVKVVSMDVNSDLEVKATIEAIIANEGRLDVLINNAGIGLGGALQDFSEKETLIELNTNLLGVFRCCKYALPHMIKQGKGSIITIGSIAGLLALPFQGFYSASKFGVEGLMESLRYEVSKFGVKVVLVNPGDFHTGFTSNRKIVDSALGGIYKESLQKTLSVIEKDETGGLNPEILAKKIGRIVKTKSPRHRYIVASIDQKLAVLLKRILPSKLFYKILASHYKVG